MVSVWWFKLRLWLTMLAGSVRVWKLLHPNTVVYTGTVLTAAIVIALGFWGWVMWPQSSLESSWASSQANKLVKQGRYDEALKSIDEHLARDPSHRPWTGLRDHLLREMKVDVRLLYLHGNKMPLKSAQSGKLTLSASDKYWYVVNPSESCHLYLFQINSAGELLQVFPNPVNSAAKNPIPPGRQEIPAGPQKLQLNQTAGVEQVIFVAARWEIPELEELARKAAGETDGGKREQAVTRFLARVENERRYRERLGGLVAGGARFTNSGLNRE